VNDNKLVTIKYPAANAELAAIPFHTLKSLSLSGNLIDTWLSLNELDRFPKLESLRFTHNPVIASLGITIGRQLVISRISKLQQLNGSAVRKQERIDSEKYYLRLIVDELATNGSNNNSASYLEINHPRYKELVEIHGKPQQSQKETQTLADELITLTLTYMGSETTKKLPSSLVVANLKILCERLFKVDTRKVRLVFKDEKKGLEFEVLEDETRPLSYYGVMDNGFIIVENH